MIQGLANNFQWYFENGYITPRDGNAAARDWKDKNAYFVTESGIDKSRIHADYSGNIRVNALGQNIDTRQGMSHRKPSIETAAHLIVLQDSGRNASVHVHSPNTVALAALCEDKKIYLLDAEPQLINSLNQKWPELFRYTKVGPMVPFLPPGSLELHEAIRKSMSQSDICIMQRHGVLAAGEDLDECREHIMRLEHISTIILKIVTARGTLESGF